MTAKATSSGTIKVRQVRSGRGFDKTQNPTLKYMWMDKLRRVREFPDNPQVRGMIAKISHLVEIVSDRE